MFSMLHFATVREREGRDCLVAKTIYFNITKLLRQGNIANGVKPLQIDQKVYAFDFLNNERGKRKTGDNSTCNID